MHLLSTVVGTISFVILLDARLVRLSVLPVKAKLNGQAAAVLSLSKSLEVIESASGVKDEFILCDVIPVPLQSQQDQRLVLAALYATRGKRDKQFIRAERLSFCRAIINRDRGLYDNLPYGWREDLLGMARKELFTLLSGGEGQSTNGERARYVEMDHGSLATPLVEGMRKILDCSLTGLLMEVKDEMSDGTISLGAAAILARSAAESNWRLSVRNPYLPDSTTDDAVIANCHLDECILLSAALNTPIYAPNDLFRAACLDARLSKSSDGQLLVESETSSVGPNPTATQTPTPAWEIFNPNKFLEFSAAQKRDILRASGVYELPRPRDGPEALNTALEDMMDDAVRQEYTRIRGASSASTERERSARSELLRMMGEALEEGDINLAEELRERFATLTLLKQDPTQVEGSYSKDLDQDDWYMAQRRRAMTSKKKTT